MDEKGEQRPPDVGIRLHGADTAQRPTSRRNELFCRTRRYAHPYVFPNVDNVDMFPNVGYRTNRGYRTAYSSETLL